MLYQTFHNHQVRNDFLSTVDNIVAVDDEELRSSNEQTGSVNRYGYHVASQVIPQI